MAELPEDLPASLSAGIQAVLTQGSIELAGGEQLPLDLLRESGRSSGLCAHVAEALSISLQARGFQACLFWLSPCALGYHDRPLAGLGAHCVTAVIVGDELYAIDLTAAQYGYSELPMILRLTVPSLRQPRFKRLAPARGLLSTCTSPAALQ